MFSESGAVYIYNFAFGQECNGAYNFVLGQVCSGAECPYDKLEIHSKLQTAVHSDTCGMFSHATWQFIGFYMTRFE